MPPFIALWQINERRFFIACRYGSIALIVATLE